VSAAVSNSVVLSSAAADGAACDIKTDDAATGMLPESGGTSGIVVDNGESGGVKHLFLDASQPKLYDFFRHERLRHTNLAVGALERG